MDKDSFAAMIELYCKTFEGDDFFWPDWLADPSNNIDEMYTLIMDAIDSGKPITLDQMSDPRTSDPYDGETVY